MYILYLYILQISGNIKKQKTTVDSNQIKHDKSSIELRNGILLEDIKT